MQHNFLVQLVAAADCAGALDVIDDLQQLLVSFGMFFFKYFRSELVHEMKANYGIFLFGYLVQCLDSQYYFRTYFQL